MCEFSHQKRGLLAGTFIAILAVASTGFAQSASDADYLDALDSMVTSMDLDGLAEQTFETQTVDAPHLNALAQGNADMANCDTVLARAEASGVPLEIFGAGAAVSEGDLAALSECLVPETGVVMSYLAPQS